MDEELSNIYYSSVKGQILPLNNLSMGSNRPIIERDSGLINLEIDIFSKIKEISKDDEVLRSNYKISDLKTFSVEDAIRELKELGEF